MGSSDGMWRDKYYIADLEHILNILGDLKRDQRLDFASRGLLDTNNLEVIHPDEAFPGSSASLSPKSSEASPVGSLPTSAKTQTSMDTFVEDEASTRMTSPSAASPNSVQRALPANKASIARVTRKCRNCGKQFSGTPYDATKNLKRHMKREKFKCPQTNCDSKPMRLDNMNEHLKRIHGIDSPQELEQAKKNSKQRGPVPESAFSPSRCSFSSSS